MTILRQGIAIAERLFGFRAPLRLPENNRMQVTIIGGYGYGNTGDEAQLGANLTRWRQLAPNAEITVLSPDPPYTTAHHECNSEYASRVVFYSSSSKPHYGLSNAVFRWRFWLLWPRMVLNAHFMRAGLAPPLASAYESKLLMRLYSSDVVHISGGGFLTGMTKSRLWDTCFIMHLCQHFGTPYFLTGQTIGVFKTRADRWLAKKALSKALAVTLRDPDQSRLELLELGITEEIITSSVDDALFCAKSPSDIVNRYLVESGVDPNRDYITVNYHWWGMDKTTKSETTRRMAQLLDDVISKTGYQVLFVPMHTVDEIPEHGVIKEMNQTALFLKYNYDYQLVRGVIAGSRFLISFKHHPLIFALGEGVPTISVSIDDYYERKNSGAMANFAMEKYCIHGDNFFKEDVERILSDIMLDDIAIRADLTSRCQELNKYSTDIFKKVIPQIDTPDLPSETC